MGRDSPLIYVSMGGGGVGSWGTGVMITFTDGMKVREM